MNAKKTRVPAARRTKSAKRPAIQRLRLNKSAALRALHDEYWQIDITISIEDGVQLGGMTLRPGPPPPPVDAGPLVAWLRGSLGY